MLATFVFGLSFFLCTSKEELDTLGRKLLTAQIVAVVCFMIFPLRYMFVRPETEGVAGFLFSTLALFDKPFNQAPSLHIAVLVILWVHYVRHTPRRALIFLNGWFGVVGISVLTAYQHHFVDVPTGVLLGALCLWLWRYGGASLVSFGGWNSPLHRSSQATGEESSIRDFS